MELFALANEGLSVPRVADMKGKGKRATNNRRFAIPALLVLLVAIMGATYLLTQNQSAPTTGISSITIFPFDIKSGNSDIQYLGNGMVDLISAKLEEVSTLNPIDPNRVFNQLKKANELIPALEQATEISSTLGAAEFVIGSIIEVNESIQISASKYDAKGKLLAKENIEGSKSQLSRLIDDLTRALIADKLEQEGLELNSIATLTSENLPALQAYLKGEQAYRQTKFREAFDLFQEAVELDSTFAIAWLRLNKAESWIGWGSTTGDYLDNALQYADKLPPKWQDLIKAEKRFDLGLPSNEQVFDRLLRKYGENAEFTNLMAEHLFHFNPIHGRSIIEAKPWLEKVRELDPQNQETLRHLGELAWIEEDQVRLQKIISKLPPESYLWLENQIRYLALKGDISATQWQEISTHPAFHPLLFNPRQAVSEDPLLLPEFGLRVAPDLVQDPRFIPVSISIASLKGQETEVAMILKKIGQISPQGELQDFELLPEMASIIASRDYLPYEEFYPSLIKALAAYEVPRAYFASAKYAWALGQEELYQSNKEKLATASQDSRGFVNPARYYHWSLAAFEARQNGDNEQALAYIDSAFCYTPAKRNGEASESAMDKIFLLADIYEEQQDYEKGIHRLENLPMLDNYAPAKFYATYRLTQLYQKSGNPEKALAKCELFLKNYQDCDAKYRPWLMEVAERKKAYLSK